MLAAATDPVAHLIDLGVAGIVIVCILWTKVLVPGWLYEQSRKDAEARLADEQARTARLLKERDEAQATIAKTRDAMDDKILPAFFASSSALDQSTKAIGALVQRGAVLDEIAPALREVVGYLRGRADG